jgi:hypothetical protein
MIKRLSAIALLTALSAAVAPPTQANPIADYTFMLDFGWSTYPQFPTIFEGHFSGTVENDGSIQLADLTSFGLQFWDPNPSPLPFFVQVFAGFGSLSFFTFNPSVGTSTLDFVVQRQNPEATYTICIGAAATLSPVCNPGTVPPATIADVLVDGAFYANDGSFPIIENVTPPPTGAVPEPAPWGTMILGLGFVGFGLYRRRSGANSAA